MADDELQLVTDHLRRIVTHLEAGESGAIDHHRGEDRTDHEGNFVSRTYSSDIDITEEWTDVKLGFVASGFDLRNVSVDVEIAFDRPTVDPTKAHAYAATEAPVTDMSAMTERVWLRSQPGQGPSTVTLDAWADAPRR